MALHRIYAALGSEGLIITFKIEYNFCISHRHIYPLPPPPLKRRSAQVCLRRKNFAEQHTSENFGWSWDWKLLEQMHWFESINERLDGKTSPPPQTLTFAQPPSFWRHHHVKFLVVTPSPPGSPGSTILINLKFECEKQGDMLGYHGNAVFVWICSLCMFYRSRVTM